MISRLFSSCLRWLAHLGHGSGWHRGATRPDGTTPKLCDTCLQPVGVILSGEMKTDGPAHSPAKVHGQPTATAHVETPRRGNVAPWKVGAR